MPLSRQTALDFHRYICRYSDLAGTQLVVASTYGYDNANELTSLDHKRADNSTIAHYGYQYNAAGWMTQMVSPDGTANYGYDAAGQIVSATYNYQPSETFAWDANGNPTGQGFVIGADNRLLTDGVNNYQYDHEGNRISQTNIATGAVVNYAWDYRNRLVDVNQQDGQSNTIMDEANTYDVFDRRIGKTVTANSSTVSQQFAYNGLGVVEAFQNGSLTNRYLQGPGLDNVFADEQVQPGPGSNTLWTLGDHLGSVRDVVDSSGVVQKHRAFGAFGQNTLDSNPAVKENYGFTGAIADSESGLINHWQRWANPATTDWMSQNREGFQQADTNLYRYAGNAPTSGPGAAFRQIQPPILPPGPGSGAWNNGVEASRDWRGYWVVRKTYWEQTIIKILEPGYNGKIIYKYERGKCRDKEVSKIIAGASDKAKKALYVIYHWEEYKRYETTKVIKSIENGKPFDIPIPPSVAYQFLSDPKMFQLYITILSRIIIASQRGHVEIREWETQFFWAPDRKAGVYGSSEDEYTDCGYGRNRAINLYPVFWAGEHGKGTSDKERIDTILHEFGRLYGNFDDTILTGYEFTDVVMWDKIMDELEKYYDLNIGRDINGIQFR